MHDAAEPGFAYKPQILPIIITGIDFNIYLCTLYKIKVE